MAKLAVKKDNGDIKDFYKEIVETINDDGTLNARLKTVMPIRLVGTTFDGNTKDPNFWTETGAQIVVVYE